MNRMDNSHALTGALSKLESGGSTPDYVFVAFYLCDYLQRLRNWQLLRASNGQASGPVGQFSLSLGSIPALRTGYIPLRCDKDGIRPHLSVDWRIISSCA